MTKLDLRTEKEIRDTARLLFAVHTAINQPNIDFTGMYELAQQFVTTLPMIDPELEKEEAEIFITQVVRNSGSKGITNTNIKERVAYNAVTIEKSLTSLLEKKIIRLENVGHNGRKYYSAL
jgi:hypothetical protein